MAPEGSHGFCPFHQATRIGPEAHRAPFLGHILLLIHQMNYQVLALGIYLMARGAV